MFCALLGQDISRAFTGPMVLWYCVHAKLNMKGQTIHQVSSEFIVKSGWGKNAHVVLLITNQILY